MFDSHRQSEPGVFVESIGVPFEAFEIGQVFEHRPGFTVSIEAVRQHVHRSLDHMPGYADLTTDLGERFVPETLVLGLTAALSTKTFGRVTANLGWQPIRMGVPVRPGDTLFAESAILGKRESASRPDQGIMHVSTRSRNQRGEETCFYERKFLIYKSQQGPHVAAGY